MFLIQHTKYPQRDFVAYAHLYIIAYLSKIIEWKSQKYNKTRLIAGFVVILFMYVLGSFCKTLFPFSQQHVDKLRDRT